MKEEGIVIKVEADAAVIEVEPQAECTKCCLCRSSKGRHITIKGEKAKGLNVGDRVEVDIDTSSMLQVYILLYGFPLVAFVTTILILYAILHSPIASFIGAIGATAICYMLVGLYIKRNYRFSPDVCVKKATNLDNKGHMC